MDWKVNYDSTYGNCYTFNFMNPPKYRSYRGGANFGLTLFAQCSHSEYICSSMTAGFKIAIHNFTEQPFPDSSGVFVPAGSNVDIALFRVSKG